MDLDRLIEKRLVLNVDASGGADTQVSDVFDIAQAKTISLHFRAVATGVSSASVKLEQSNDPTAETDPNNANWVDIGSAQAVSATGDFLIEKLDPTTRWMRISATSAAGTMVVTGDLLVKGEEV